MTEWIVSSSALIVIVLLVRFLLREKLSLRVRYMLWLLVLVRLLVPVSFGESELSVLNALDTPRPPLGRVCPSPTGCRSLIPPVASPPAPVSLPSLFPSVKRRRFPPRSTLTPTPSILSHFCGRFIFSVRR
ncbi:MAG: hypothetical protein IIX99_00700 [Oscillospiraceae bacterium]|nr:hypothetical protein [Oscillospiraceae bacterium]